MSFAGRKYSTEIQAISTQVADDQANFVQWYDMSQLDTSVWANIKDGGGDLIIANGDGTIRYPLHVVSCNTITENGQIWFKAPVTSASNTEYLLYYGNTSASQPGVSDTYGQYNVYPSNWISKWDLEEVPNGTAGQIKDATSNQNNGTSINNPTSETALVGDGVKFLPANSAINLGKPANLSPTGLAIFSINALIKTPAIMGSNNKTIFSKGDTQYAVQILNDGHLESVVYNSSPAGWREVESDSPLLANTWYYINMCVNNGTLSLYINAVKQLAESLYTSVNSNIYDVCIGANDEKIDREFEHIIDSVVFLNNTCFTQNQINTNYNNITSNNTFYITGSETINIVILLTPLNAAINIVTNPTLTWEEVAGAATYNLQVSKVVDFTTTVSDVTGIVNESYGLSSLDSNTKYYWRVAHVDASGTSEWSTVFDFTTEAGTPTPEPPILIIPINGATNTVTNPIFTWSVVPDIDTYNLEVSEDIGFTNIVIDQAGLISNSYNSSDLEKNKTYYWRVNTKLGELTSVWSTIFYFTTKKEGQDMSDYGVGVKTPSKYREEYTPKIIKNEEDLAEVKAGTYVFTGGVILPTTDGTKNYLVKVNNTGDGLDFTLQP